MKRYSPSVIKKPVTAVTVGIRYTLRGSRGSPTPSTARSAATATLILKRRQQKKKKKNR